MIPHKTKDPIQVPQRQLKNSIPQVFCYGKNGRFSQFQQALKNLICKHFIHILFTELKNTASRIYLISYLVSPIILIFVLAIPVYGYVMESSGYRIQSDSLNVGGLRSESASYIQESTVGEIATGVSDSTSYSLKAGYQQMSEVFISMTAAADVTMSPDIGGITGGQSDGQTNVTVATDGAAGYELKIEAQTDPALQTAASVGDPTSAGPEFPTSVDNNTEVGTVAWSYPENVEGDTENAASVVFSSGAVGTASNYLKATDFGFAIPVGATIQGIEVEWEKSNIGSGLINDNAIKIVKGGTVGSEDKSSGTSWSRNYVYTSYGGDSDLWGESWTVSDINSSTFGAVLSAKCGSTCGSVIPFPQPGVGVVIRARITVFYQEIGDSFGDYVTSVLNIPDFNFNVEADSAELGYSPEGDDTVQLFRDNGSSCNSEGGSITTDKCWIGLSTTARSISTRTTGNWPSGTATTIKFKAFSGSNHVQVAGVYTATTTLTAVAL